MRTPFFIDFHKALKERELWMTIAWVELKKSYSGTKLGVLWRPLSATIVGLSLGMVYSILLQKDAEDYIPYVITGLVVWTYMSQLIIEGGKLFFANSAQIKEMPLSYLSYIFKYLLRNAISVLLGFIPVALVLIYFGDILNVNVFKTFIGIIVLSLNGFWISILLGIATLHLKDLIELTANIMRLVFFITPVLWTTDMAGAKGEIVELNPLFYFLDIVRSPLIGHEVHQNSYLATLSITAVGLIASYFVYNIYRDKISFMV